MAKQYDRKPQALLGWNRDEPFRRPASELKQSPFLASTDIIGKNIRGLAPGTIEVVISDIRIADEATFDAGRTKRDVPLLCFAKAKKVLVLNATNRKRLIAAWGENVTWWFGKKVLLYVEHGIRVGKETKDGIRLNTVTPDGFPPDDWSLPKGWVAGDPIPAVGDAQTVTVDAPIHEDDDITDDIINDDSPASGGLTEPPDDYVSGSDTPGPGKDQPDTDRSNPQY